MCDRTHFCFFHHKSSFFVVVVSVVTGNLHTHFFQIIRLIDFSVSCLFCSSRFILVVILSQDLAVFFMQITVASRVYGFSMMHPFLRIF